MAVKVDIARLENGKGKLKIKFHYTNDTYYETEFQDFSILCDTLLQWRSIYGTQLYIDGMYSDTVNRKNQHLKARAYIFRTGRRN